MAALAEQRHPLPRARASSSRRIALLDRSHQRGPAARQHGPLDQGAPPRHAAAPLEISDPRLFGPMAREVSVLAKSLHRARAAAEEEAALRLVGRDAVDRGAAQAVRQAAAGRLPALRRLEPRAPEPRLEGRPDPGGAPGLRPRDGHGARDARLRRRLGGAGSGDADRETADETGRLGLPPDDPALHAAPGLARARRRRRATTTASPTRGCGRSATSCTPARSSAPRTGRTTRRSTRSSPRPSSRRSADVDSPLILIQDYHFALLPGLHQARAPGRPRRASSGTFPGPTRRPSASARGSTSCCSACSAPTSSASTPSTTATTSSRRSSARIEARVEWEQFAVTRGAADDARQAVSRSAWRRETSSANPPHASPARTSCASSASPASSWASASSGSTTPRACPSASGPSGASSSASRVPGAPRLRPARGAEPLAASRATRRSSAEVDAAVRDVNTRFATRKWRPVLYLKRHHDHREIWPFYRHADFCMVTSLHDGMNLVAKEFVSVREDGRRAHPEPVHGRLLASSATPCSSTPTTSTAWPTRSAARSRCRARSSGARMGRMRQTVREHNIYRWAGLLLGELSRIPDGSSASHPTTSSVSRARRAGGKKQQRGRDVSPAPFAPLQPRTPHPALSPEGRGREAGC